MNPDIDVVDAGISDHHGDGSATDTKDQREQSKYDSGNCPLEGSIVIVAKCPIPGKSKTRLIPLLGEEGSVRLARSMLSDVLKTIDGCPELNNVRKVLLYAPGTPQGLEMMEAILDELGLNTRSEDITDNYSNTENYDERFDAWHLLPMLASSKTNDLRSHDLGAKLEDALIRVRDLKPSAATMHPGRHGVVFLGMDAPILPLDDIVGGLKRAAASICSSAEPTQQEVPSATLCPAFDGGYAMLCLPHHADPSKTFGGLYWSHLWTGMSQLKALTDQGIHVSVGTIVRDIDEASDVRELSIHLGIVRSQATTDEMDVPESSSDTPTKNLEFPSQWLPGFGSEGGAETASRKVTSSHPSCHFTRRALEEALDGRSGL